MAFCFGQHNEFSDPVTLADPVIEAVARAIELGPFAGQFYQSMGAPMASLTNKTFKIFSRTKTSRNGAIDANWDIDDVAGLGVSDDALKGLTIGHVLDIGGEVVIISAIDRAAGTISVHKRGDGDTTAAIHASGDTFEVIGFAGNDTDLKNVESMTEATEEWENYSQTVFETIDWTKHAELLRQGLSSANAIAILIREAEIRIAELLSAMAIRGVKAKATNVAGRYMSAGLLAQLGDVVNRGARRYNVNGVLNEVKFRASLKAMFDVGGSANTIWVSPTVKGYINAFIGADSSVALVDSKGNHTAGGVYVDSYNYEGAILKVRVDSGMPNDRIAIVNQAKCKKGWLADDGLRLVDEPPVSSREMRKSLQGSIGFLIEDVGSDHTLLYGITGGSTEREYKTVINGVGDGVTLPVSGTIAGGVTATGNVTATGDFVREITVNADSEVPAASADNFGYRVKIGTAWAEGTKIVTAVVGEVYASNGAAWVKQSA